NQLAEHALSPCEGTWVPAARLPWSDRWSPDLRQLREGFVAAPKSGALHREEAIRAEKSARRAAEIPVTELFGWHGPALADVAPDLDTRWSNPQCNPLPCRSVAGR